MIGVMPTAQRFGEPGMVGLILGRPRAQRAFSAKERGALARVIPAMNTVIARDRRMRARECDRDYAAAVLRQLRHPAVVLDRRGTIAWRSPRADELLRAHATLGRELTDAVRRSRSGSIVLPSGHRAELHRARLADGRAIVIAELRDARAIEDTVLATARRMGLTRAESSVLACIARGLDNRSIAAELHVSEATVKTHLRGVLAKLGVTSRTQAALVALGQAPRP
jgi:DNA-binding CsgD family transcriptional regulator